MAFANNVIEELKSMFPQHNADVITHIYREVGQLFGDAFHPSVRDSCVERLLDIPDDFVVPPSNKEDIPKLEDRGDLLNIPAHSSDSSYDTDEDSEDSDDDLLSRHDYYRNKARPTYRESEKISSDENSQDYSNDVYFPNDGTDELFLLEELSTAPEEMKPKELDENDGDVIEVNFILGSKRKLKTPDMPSKMSKTSVNDRVHSTPVTDVHTPIVVKTNISIPNRFPQPNFNVSNSISFGGSSASGTASSSTVTVHASSSKTPIRLKSSSTITSSKVAQAFKNTAATSATITTPNSKQPTAALLVPIMQQPVATKEMLVPVLVDIANLKKGMKDFDYYVKKQVKEILTDVSTNYLENLIKGYPDQTPLDDVVSGVINHLVEEKSYPKEENVVKKSTTTETLSSTITSSNIFEYQKHSVQELQNRFPMVRTKVIRALFSQNKNKYIPTLKQIERLLEEISSGKKRVEQTPIGDFMKGRRYSYSISEEKLDPLLSKEIQEVTCEKKRLCEVRDFETAIAINNQQYEEDGQLIECGCCFGESPFDDMVQCMEGHLFCSECLRSYSNVATFGGGSSSVVCMTTDCGANFPMSQLRKALPEKTLNKFQEIQQNEALKLANIENLFTCPHCEFAAEVTGEDKVFHCQNPSCMKETCMKCKEPWDDSHFGVPCEELEKQDVAKLRKDAEEKMTQAKIRTCWKCKSTFLKESGCNKITCKCGAKMCYICRKPKIDYSHFCQHVRDPGNPCKQCNSCSLWTNPEEDDDRAIKEIQDQAEKEKKLLNGEGDSGHIGPKIEMKPQLQQGNGRHMDLHRILQQQQRLQQPHPVYVFNHRNNNRHNRRRR